MSAPVFPLRLFVFIYFGILLLTAVLSVWFASEYAEASWAATAVATGVLSVFGILGVIMTMAFGKVMLRPLTSITRYVANILDGNYDRAEEDAVGKSMPGLGPLVSELSSRFKERLGFSNSVLNGLPIPCCIVDTEQNITFLNHQCLKMLGSTEKPESFHGKKISQIFYKDDRRSKIADIMETNTSAMNIEASFVHANASEIKVLINLFPLNDVEGAVIGGCCLYLDTTELKAREAQILTQNDRINHAAQEATQVSEELAEAAAQLGMLVNNARQGTCTQTERTGETATAMEEMNVTVLEVARNAQDAALDADDARTKAEEGASIVTDVVQAINEVAVHAEELRSSMEDLDERAEGIGKVLGVIEDIADQTNLLALNAAIEAARAGEAGRGFAVVADEVRKLAEKTMQATNEVHSAVTRIQDGARQNVKATEIAVESVKKSTEMAGRSGEALNSIVMVAEATADRVRSIATAAEQQSATSDEINRSTMDVNRVCGETDTLMVNASEAIAHLAELSDSLGKIIREMQ